MNTPNSRSPWGTRSTKLALVTRSLLALSCTLLLTECSTPKGPAEVVVSVKDQKLGFYRGGKLTKEFKISTSKFGLGDKPGSNCTPLGKAEVIAKIGHGLPSGAVIKSRQWNGEVLKPNAPGRDPIVSRILWLRGLEYSNRNAFNRFIYIHGTTEENRIGQPASYGCVRMKSKDVIDLFNTVSIGAKVIITDKRLPGHTSLNSAEKMNENLKLQSVPTGGTTQPTLAGQSKSSHVVSAVH
jgi:hypothetical protein